MISWQIKQIDFAGGKTPQRKVAKELWFESEMSSLVPCVNAWSPSSGLCYFRGLSNLWEVAPVAWPHFLPAFRFLFCQNVRR